MPGSDAYHIRYNCRTNPWQGSNKFRVYFIFVAFALVLAFMIFYYSKSAGTIADIALFANLFLPFGVLASLNAVLSLPGIAGIVLTMGMGC